MTEYIINIEKTVGDRIHGQTFFARTASEAKKALKDVLVAECGVTAKRANEKVRGFDATYIKKHGLKVWGRDYVATIKLDA